MQHKRLILSVLLLLGVGLARLQAQEIINTTGGNALGSGGSVSYSVGQIVYTTNTGTSGSAVQGIQQPFEISLVTAIEEAKGINLSVSAYPNPTNDYLTLSIDELDVSNLSYQLSDLQGKLILQANISSNQSSIDMANLLPAIYFVKVFHVEKEVKIFKIIKN